MSDSKEAVTEKKGRGSPSNSDKKDTNERKRNAEADKNYSPPAKKGRGRPKGSTKKSKIKKPDPMPKAPRKAKNVSSSESDESHESP